MDSQSGSLEWILQRRRQSLRSCVAVECRIDDAAVRTAVSNHDQRSRYHKLLLLLQFIIIIIIIITCYYLL